MKVIPFGSCIAFDLIINSEEFIQEVNVLIFGGVVLRRLKTARHRLVANQSNQTIKYHFNNDRVLKRITLLFFAFFLLKNQV